MPTVQRGNNPVTMYVLGARTVEPGLELPKLGALFSLYDSFLRCVEVGYRDELNDE